MAARPIRSSDSVQCDLASLPDVRSGSGLDVEKSIEKAGRCPTEAVSGTEACVSRCFADHLVHVEESAVRGDNAMATAMPTSDMDEMPWWHKFVAYFPRSGCHFPIFEIAARQL